jgi:hypothetical protein
MKTCIYTPLGLKFNFESEFGKYCIGAVRRGHRLFVYPTGGQGVKTHKVTAGGVMGTNLLDTPYM